MTWGCGTSVPHPRFDVVSLVCVFDHTLCVGHGVEAVRSLLGSIGWRVSRELADRRSASDERFETVVEFMDRDRRDDANDRTRNDDRNHDLGSGPDLVVVHADHLRVLDLPRLGGAF